MTNPFDPNWYPKYWLAFLLLHLPAGNNALNYLVPQKISNPDMTGLPPMPKKTNKVGEDTPSFDSKNRPSTPSGGKSPMLKKEVRHVVAFEFPDIMLGEKRKLLAATDYNMERERLKELIAIAEACAYQADVTSYTAELYELLKKGPPKN